mgnify:CR=1 FL=1|jgi:hypothetical protein|tara:strand:+ start:2796 stop:3098 length:303 start_codon:yes stop_codon:yes gene_type:complete
MWTEFINMTVPALVGSIVTFAGIILSNRLKTQKLEFDVDAAQDEVWLDLVRQSRIEYALQRKENNRLRYITHHLQEEIDQLEKKNSELLEELRDYRTQEQ